MENNNKDLNDNYMLALILELLAFYDKYAGKESFWCIFLATFGLLWQM